MSDGWAAIEVMDQIERRRLANAERERADYLDARAYLVARLQGTGGEPRGTERTISPPFSPSPHTPTDGLLTYGDAAAELGVHVKTIRARVHAGDLAAVRIGRAVRIHRAELDRFMAAGGA